MNDILTEQLDQSISALLAGHGRMPENDSQLSELIQIADELRCLPHPEFRRDLHSALHAEAALAVATRSNARLLTTERKSIPGKPDPRSSVARDILVPPLFLTGSSAMPVRGSHLAISFALHMVATALVIVSGWVLVENRTALRPPVVQLIPGPTEDLLPVAPGKIGGGGGGGDRDKMDASKGSPPRFAAEQLTPPAVVVRNEAPKLTAEPTVIGPPDLVLPQADKYGDPMANVLNPPSNGIGSGGGIGSGRGGGVGSGEGPGVGEGRGGGIGGGIYRVGGGVSAPRPIFDPDPEYSEEARKAKFQGIVLLSAVIGPDGRPRELRIVRSLGMGLDQKALDAVGKWRFAPGTKDNHPVSVQVNIEVQFRLY